MTRRLAALAIPVVAGMLWMALASASSNQLAMQGGALVVGALIAGLGPRLAVPTRPLGIALVAVLFLPFVLGPDIEGKHRWIGTGAVVLTTALLSMPTLSVLLSRARRSWFVAPLILIFAAALFQPDPSIILSLGFILAALGGTNLVSLAAGALLVGLGSMIAVRDTLEPVRFVEGVFAEAVATMPMMAGALGAALLASGVLLLTDREVPTIETRALVACLGGLLLASLIGPFPTPLVGYGPAAILGLSLALAILTPSEYRGRAA